MKATKIVIKSIVIALIAVVAVIVIFLLAFLGCFLYSLGEKDKSETVEALSTWMNYIEDDARICDVVIPGAHDAATVGMIWYSCTQDKTVGEELASGARYLDIRITFKDNEYKAYHGPATGISYEEILDDVVSFLEQNPSETVILDFQHFENGAQDYVAQRLSERLDGMLIAREGNAVDFVESLTLGEMRGKALVFWGEDVENLANYDFLFARNDDEGAREDDCALTSYYEADLNSVMRSATYISEALPHYIELNKQVRGMTVLQGQRTDKLRIRGPRFLEREHAKNMNAYVENLVDSDDLPYINIIMRDFVTPYKNALAIRLNATKGLVKSDCAEAFATMLASAAVN